MRMVLFLCPDLGKNKDKSAASWLNFSISFSQAERHLSYTFRDNETCADSDAVDVKDGGGAELP